MAGYTAPGVTLTEVFRPSTVNLVTSLRIPCIIGKAATYITVTNEAVERSSTGYADDLANTASGIVSILTVGSQKNLDDYIVTTDYSLVSDQVLWTSTGTSPTTGTDYYVSYTYTRPTTDYKYKEFTNLGALIQDLGPIEDDTQNISLMAYVMMKKNNVSRVATVQVQSPYSATNFNNAIDLAKAREIQDIVALSTSTTVQAYARAHVIERSLPQNKKERIYWTGSASGTTYTAISARAIALLAENVVYVSPTRAKCAYIDAITKLEVITVVDGAFIAGAVCGFRDQFLDPAQPILRRQVQGLELYDEDLETYFTDTIMDSMAGNGVLVLAPTSTADLTPKIRDDVTTDTTTVEKTELNVITAKHYMNKVIRTRMDDTFIGQKIINRAYYSDIVNNYLSLILQRALADAIISQIVTTSATILAATPRTVNIYYEYIPIYSNKIISGEYVLTSG